jgi:predicted AlkP superfamily phosphohydrolase/phosphomutase
MNRKVIVIGLDGATFRLLDPLLAAGHLPTFARLIERGARGPLRSTLPANSAAGWTAFMTGKNPGKTGIFGFFALAQQGYQVTLNCGGNVRARTLWELVSEAGQRVAVINVPYTYPPRPVNGVLVSGMDAPGLQHGTYPPEFGAELLAACPGYQIEMPPVRHHREVKKQWFVEHLADYVEARWSATRYVQQTVSPHLLVSVFTAPDRVHHWVMDDVDSTHPLHDPTQARRYGRILADLYRQLDGVLKSLLETMGDQTTLFIISDHGANGFYRRFLINHWLHYQGWLALVRGATLTPVQQVMRYLRRQSRLYNLAQQAMRAVPFFQKSPFSYKPVGLSWRLQIINWSRTQAFYVNGLGIRLNLRGREPQGIVKPDEYEAVRGQIIRDLQAVRDPASGAPVYAAVHRREDVYHGPYLEQAADIILEEHTLNSDARLNFSTSGALYPHRLDELFAVKRLPGDHDLEGILLAAGPGMRAGASVTGARLMDLAPTILYTLGLPIPQDMDGTVLIDLFDETFIRQQPIAYGETAAEPERVVEPYEADELVEQRLRELGYFE